jgi:hypothetical protein
MAVLTRAIKAALHEASKPETFVKGEEFENFIKSKLFTSDDYDTLERTHDYTSNKNDFIDSSKKPDFKFRSRKSGKEFFVEAKYRSALYKGSFEFKPYQLERYRAINKETPVFIGIGIGSQPKSPEQVFLVPVRDIRYTTLFHSSLSEYQVPLAPAYKCKKAIDTIVESL